jgi:asparagine synthase (glutamine-hydrolysing)
VCGIAALVSAEAQDMVGYAEKMIDVVAHRGPHGSGLLAFAQTGQEITLQPRGNMVLAHRRLAVIDPSPQGQQPMQDHSGRYAVTFNGEIYNHQALRAQLVSMGYTFVSRTDTEVLLCGWAAWGPAVLDRLLGMFAFVLVDRVEKKLWAVRDRFGIKPLYYWQSPNYRLLAFGSEIKQFLGLPHWQARVNGQRAWDFLVWNVFDHTEETLFSGVLQLRPGTMLCVQLDSAQATLRPEVQRWYCLTPQAIPADSDPIVLRDTFRALLDESVALHLTADVPLGATLSGGLDSSTLVGLATQLRKEGGAHPEPMATFSARSHAPQWDEGRFIGDVVQHTGVTNHQVFPEGAGLMASLALCTWHLDEPFGSTSFYAQWQVYQQAREQGISVVLDGQGADEILCGYPLYFGARLADLARMGNFSAYAQEVSHLQRFVHMPVLQSVARSLDFLLPPGVRQMLRYAGGRASSYGTWQIDADRLGAQPQDPFAHRGPQASGGRSRFTDLSLQQVTESHLPMLLHCADRNAMAHGVEARVPFLDHRLVEFCLGLPPSQRIGQGETKKILRQAAQGVVPPTVLARRDKIGFATAEAQWAMESGAFDRLLAQAVEASNGVICPQVLKEWKAVRAGKRRYHSGWWRLMHFGVWLQRFDLHIA